MADDAPKGSPLINRSGILASTSNPTIAVEAQHRKDEADWHYWMRLIPHAVAFHAGKQSADADLLNTLRALEAWLREP